MFEFCYDDLTPRPRRGMTSLEATMYLKQVCPDISRWLCWSPFGGGGESRALTHIPVGTKNRGTLGAWKWARIDIDYPPVSYWSTLPAYRAVEESWVGLISITSPNGTKFKLFSFLNSRGEIGDLYMSSTHDRSLLKAFKAAVQLHFDKDLDKAKLYMFPGDDICLDASAAPQIYLPPGILEDIQTQVDAFFGSPDLYRKHNIPHRRGFLFVGSPGNGKTMMVRHLVRHCWVNYKTRVAVFAPLEQDDRHCLKPAFKFATRDGAGIVILEEIDSIMKEGYLGRATILETLDGLNSQNGTLVLATTNNPEDVDPALAHRPSRFDRVWHFHSPDLQLRSRYLRDAFVELDVGIVNEIAAKTNGWSFAYLHELRTSALVLSVTQNGGKLTTDFVYRAFDLLQAQFKSGRKNHAVEQTDQGVGFKVA